MLKKTLVSAAIAASLLSGMAQAATVTVATPLDYSLEGSEAATGYASPEIVVTLGAEYQVGDTVTLDFTSAFEDGQTAPTPTVSGAPVMSLGFLSKDDAAGTITYRVTARAAATTAATITFAAGDFDFDDASVELTNDVAVTYSAQTSTGVIIDNATTNTLADIVELKDELSSSVTTALDGVVDVTAERLALTAATDVLQVTTARVAALTDPSVINSTTIVINGDFSWIVDQNATTEGVQTNVVAATGGTSLATTVEADKITIVDTGTTVGAYNVTFTPGNNFVAPATAPSAVIVDQDYTVDVSVNYDVGAGDNDDVNAAAAAGSWTLNGATRTVQAYPLGSNVSNFLWVTNDGSLAGEISVMATANGTTYNLGNVGTAEPKTLTYIAGEVQAALGAEGIFSGRVQLEVTVNAPDANIDVYAGYKVNSDADRLNLNVEGN